MSNLAHDIEKIEADISACLESPYGSPAHISHLANLIIVKDELVHRMEIGAETETGVSATPQSAMRSQNMMEPHHEAHHMAHNAHTMGAQTLHTGG